MQQKLAIPENSLFLCNLRNWIDCWELKREPKRGQKQILSACSGSISINQGRFIFKPTFFYFRPGCKKKEKRENFKILSHELKKRKKSFVRHSRFKLIKNVPRSKTNKQHDLIKARFVSTSLGVINNFRVKKARCLLPEWQRAFFRNARKCAWESNLKRVSFGFVHIPLFVWTYRTSSEHWRG